MKDKLNHIAHLSLGSNVGQREKNLQLTRELLEDSGIKILKKSSIYETEPWGETAQESFLNQVLSIRTNLDHRALFHKIKHIEIACGRTPSYKWGPRVIDIDLLFFGRLIIQSQDLTIPHPGIQDRRFILEPLSEIAANFDHPVLQQTVQELLHICKDNSSVSIWNILD